MAEEHRKYLEDLYKARREAKQQAELENPIATEEYTPPEIVELRKAKKSYNDLIADYQGGVGGILDTKAFEVGAPKAIENVVKAEQQMAEAEPAGMIDNPMMQFVSGPAETEALLGIYKNLGSKLKGLLTKTPALEGEVIGEAAKVIKPSLTKQPKPDIDIIPDNLSAVVGQEAPIEARKAALAKMLEQPKIEPSEALDVEAMVDRFPELNVSKELKRVGEGVGPKYKQALRETFLREPGEIPPAPTMPRPNAGRPLGSKNIKEVVPPPKPVKPSIKPQVESKVVPEGVGPGVPVEEFIDESTIVEKVKGKALTPEAEARVIALQEKAHALTREADNLLAEGNMNYADIYKESLSPEQQQIVNKYKQLQVEAEDLFKQGDDLYRKSGRIASPEGPVAHKLTSEVDPKVLSDLKDRLSMYGQSALDEPALGNIIFKGETPVGAVKIDPQGHVRGVAADPAYQGQGIMSEAYRDIAKSRGALRSDTIQTEQGKNLWSSIEDKYPKLARQAISVDEFGTNELPYKVLRGNVKEIPLAKEEDIISTIEQAQKEIRSPESLSATEILSKLKDRLRMAQEDTLYFLRRTPKNMADESRMHLEMAKDRMKRGNWKDLDTVLFDDPKQANTYKKEIKAYIKEEEQIKKQILEIEKKALPSEDFQHNEDIRSQIKKARQKLYKSIERSGNKISSLDKDNKEELA